MKLWTIVCLAAALGVQPGSGRCDTPPTITPEMIRADPRLSVRVSISEPNIYLRELLSTLSAKTRVTMVCGRSDDPMDVRLCVFCHDVPLKDLMDGLWSLVSYRGALWHWERTGAGSEYRYTLRPSVSSVRFRQTIRDWMQGYFERLIGRMLDAVDGTDEEKRSAIKAFYHVERHYSEIPQDVFWGQVRILKEAVPRETLAALLRPDSDVSSITVPAERLSPASQGFLARESDFLFANTFSTNGGPPQHPAAQSEIHILRFKRAGSPTLSVEYQHARTALYYLGGGEIVGALIDHMEALWWHPGDEHSSSVESAVIRPVAEDRLALLGLSSASAEPFTCLASALFEVSDGTHTNLLARLPDNEPAWLLRRASGGTMQQFWSATPGRPMRCKFRNGLLLATSLDWPLQDGPVPLELLQSLRSCAIPGSFLPLEALSRASDLLSSAQLSDLRWEFPVMERVGRVRGLLALFHHYPDLGRKALSPEGLPLTDTVVNELLRLPAPAPPPFMQSSSPFERYVSSPNSRYLRVRVDTGSSDGPRGITFDFLRESGKPWAGINFASLPQPQKDSPELP